MMSFQRLNESGDLYIDEIVWGEWYSNNARKNPCPKNSCRILIDIYQNICSTTYDEIKELKNRFVFGNFACDVMPQYLCHQKSFSSFRYISKNWQFLFGPYNDLAVLNGVRVKSLRLVLQYAEDNASERAILCSENSDILETPEFLGRSFYWQNCLSKIHYFSLLDGKFRPPSERFRPNVPDKDPIGVNHM